MKKDNVFKLKKQVEDIRADKAAVEKDLVEYRNFIKGEIKTQLNNLKNNRYNPPENLLKKYIQLVSGVDGFYIWLD